MSYSSTVKDELTEVSVLKNHCRRAELAGIIYAASTLSITGKGVGLSVSTESMNVVKRIISLIEKLFFISPELTAVEQLPKTTPTYIVKISGGSDTRGILDELGLHIGAGIEPNRNAFNEIISKDCCRKAFLRGAFLGSGSISDPNKVYHLEIVMGSKTLAEVVSDVMSKLGISSGLVSRKDDYIIYIKESEQIIEFLTHIGAHSAICELENIRILKNINNNINRAYNCESANIDRTIASSEEQIKCIKLIEKHIGFDKLAESLRQTAELRMDNPYASLSELAAIDGNISRSALNHRMRKLKEIAYSIQIKEDK